ncbi:unnamed protein product [Heligmosomoides polygyrus]|uniref:DDE_3 domain-containing protein n=1 Tax=Heligmosomoides polygyrus TaxID=6339 RepID=A0A183FWD9_HELPZ|nr:unnamed protein product [Heligmosomoides polygyrus]
MLALLSLKENWSPGKHILLQLWFGVQSPHTAVFVESSAKNNKGEYKKTILEDILKHWADARFENDRWYLMQDSAAAHKARTTQQWCKHELPDIIAPEDCPPNSPDPLYPLDFLAWSVIESKVCSTRHASLTSLKASLMKAWNEMSDDRCATCDAFITRLGTCVRMKGGHFE